MPLAVPDVDVDLSVLLDAPYDVVLHNDPVNTFEYVTEVLTRVFGYPHGRSRRLAQDVHDHGRAAVWSGGHDDAVTYTRTLGDAGLTATCEKAR